jgi:large subunit ribosomal protein L23
VRSPDQVILKPLISEKSYLAMQFGKYTFDVHPSANKVEIKKAIEEAFDVKVVAVNTLHVNPKVRRRRTTGGGTAQGMDPRRKKAIVTLAAGQRIDRLFENTAG